METQIAQFYEKFKAFFYSGNLAHYSRLTFLTEKQAQAGFLCMGNSGRANGYEWDFDWKTRNQFKEGLEEGFPILGSVKPNRSILLRRSEGSKEEERISTHLIESPVDWDLRKIVEDKEFLGFFRHGCHDIGNTLAFKYENPEDLKAQIEKLRYWYQFWSEIYPLNMRTKKLKREKIWLEIDKIKRRPRIQETIGELITIINSRGCDESLFGDIIYGFFDGSYSNCAPQ